MWIERQVGDELRSLAASFPILVLVGRPRCRLALSGPFGRWAAVDKLRKAHPSAEFLWRGGYPALWAELAEAPSRDRWYQSCLATYLERDVRNLLNIGSLRDFEHFLRAAAARAGQTLNMSELGRDVGIATSAVKQWLSVLQASGQVLLLEPFYRSLGKRLSSPPTSTSPTPAWPHS